MTPIIPFLVLDQEEWQILVFLSGNLTATVETMISQKRVQLVLQQLYNLARNIKIICMLI